MSVPRPRSTRAYGWVLLVPVLVLGCARPEPVPGDAVPLTRPATSTPTAAPSRVAPVASPSGTPTPPTAFATFRLERAGLTVALPVPTTWSLTRTEHGIDFGDPTGTALLRLEIRPATAPTARQGWEQAEPGFRARLPGYRRLGLDDVPGVGDDAADLTFSFVRDGVTRRVVDRGVLVGDTGLALYYSAPQDSYDRLKPVFDRAARAMRLS